MKALLITLLALCSTLHAEVWSGTSDVKFKATSTLHDFEGTVNTVPLKVTVKGEKGNRTVSATSDVEVKRMTTDEKDRDENMWKMFNTAAFKLYERYGFNEIGRRRDYYPAVGGREDAVVMACTLVD